jgi:lipopolysaccharide export system protein LptC
MSVTARAYAAINTVFSVGTGTGPITYVPVAKVQNIAGPKFSKDTAETTNYDSAGWKEYEGTLNGCQVDLNLIWTDETSQDGLLQGALTATDPTPFQIAYPSAMTAKKFTFSGIVNKFELKNDVKGVYEAAVTIMVSGAVVYA